MPPVGDGVKTTTGVQQQQGNVLENQGHCEEKMEK
jgi:hypothetical protein